MTDQDEPIRAIREEPPAPTAAPARRTPGQVFRSVVFALIVRELKTRFGKWRLGYAWAILEPLLFITMFTVIIVFLRGRSPWFGIPVPVFMGIGLLLLFFFRGLTVQSTGAVASNASLFGYRQVKPFDTLVARLILELLLFLGTIVMLCWIGVWFFGYDLVPYDPVRTLEVLAILVWLSFGFGLMFAVFGALMPELAKVVPLALNRPLLFLSCVMYPLVAVPENLQPLLLWNPLAHIIEQARLSFVPGYPAHQTNLLYPIQVAVVANAFGMLLYTAKRHRLIAS